MEDSFARRRGIRAVSRSVWQKAQNVAKKVGSLIWKPGSTASNLTFHIWALSQPTAATVKESLQAKLEGLVNTSEIRNDAVATLSSQDEMNIAALKSLDVGIEIGMAACFLCSLFLKYYIVSLFTACSG